MSLGGWFNVVIGFMYAGGSVAYGLAGNRIAVVMATYAAAAFGLAWAAR